MTTTTNSGVADTETVTAPLGEEEATEAFMSRLFPDEGDADASKKKPSENDEDDTQESDTEEQSDDAEASDESPEEDGEKEGDEEKSEDAGKAKKYVDEDDTTFVKVKVGEEEHEVPVKDLKRLFGQEAALTKKSQAVASQLASVEKEREANAVRLKALTERATSRANYFRSLPWMQMAKDPSIDGEQMAILQKEAQQAIEEETFLKAETDALIKVAQEQTVANLAQQASTTVKTLGDQSSPLYIEGWNQKLYDDMRSFAVDQGVPAQIVNQIVDAPTLKLLHMAMLYQKGAQRVQVVKKDKSPKKIVKTSQAPAAQDISTSKAKQKQAKSRLAQTHSEDDAVAAFMALDGGDEE
jgi:hypothetical protein